jgi:hypothetical protein
VPGKNPDPQISLLGMTATLRTHPRRGSQTGKLQTSPQRSFGRAVSLIKHRLTLGTAG